MLSLNIQLHSFEFAKTVLDGKDKVRVSITTLPDKQKQAFVFDVEKMCVAHPSFTINFSELTEEIIFVFRKCNVFSDNIVASTAIKSHEFPKLFNGVNNLSLCEMKIYEPIQQASGKKDPENRKIVGKMLAQFYLTEVYQRQNKVIYNKSCSTHSVQQKNLKIGSILNQNHSNDSLLFSNLISN